MVTENSDFNPENLPSNNGKVDLQKLVDSICGEKQDQKDLLRGKIKTGTFANYYLSVYAYQTLMHNLSEADKYTPENDEADISRFRAKTMLIPKLKQVLSKSMLDFAYRSADLALSEVLVSHTDLGYKDYGWSTEIPEYQPGYMQSLKDGGEIINFDDYDLPPSIAWKLLSLRGELVNARQHKDAIACKKVIGEIGKLTFAVLKNEEGWSTLTSALQEYGTADTIDGEIISSERIISANHGHGEMLEYTASNYPQARAFLDAKEVRGNEWVVAECADVSLVAAIREYPKLIPMDPFEKPIN